jgi:D-3-phosphoglycerate dehydrogenase
MQHCQAVLVINEGPPMPAWVHERLAHAGVDFAIHLCRTKADLEQFAADADIVWVNGGARLLTRENLAVLRRCGAIVRVGSGTDNIDVKAATEMGIIVANTPYVLSDAVASHAIALLLSLLRQVARLDRRLRQGTWASGDVLPLRRPEGAHLGLVGFGRIPQRVARKVRGFDMQITAYDPYVPAEVMAGHGVAKSDSLDTLLAQSDIVSLHCPLTEETRHLIGERELRLMQPHAVLINTSRGAVVDEPALIRALREGWIAGAGLDVFEQEPCAPDNPLLSMDNVVVTPHTAGYTDTYPTDFITVCVEAIIDLAQRRWPPSVVNPSVKPRWGALTPGRKL